MIISSNIMHIKLYVCFLKYKQCLCFFIPQPLIDCMACYKTFNNVIQENPKPYIHCVHKPALTKVDKIHLVFFGTFDSIQLFCLTNLKIRCVLALQ